MAAEWFCQAAGHRYGPITSGELRRLADTGIVTADTPVRKGVDGRWVRAEKVQGLFQGDDSPRTTAGGQNEPRSLPSPPPLPPNTPPVVSDSPRRMNRWLLAGVLATAGAVMVTLLVVIVAVLTLGVESRAFIASRDTPVSETDKVPIAPVVVRSWSSSKKTPDRAAKAGVAADMRSPTVLARAEARPVAAPTPTSSPIANADNGNGSVKPRPAESKLAPDSWWSQRLGFSGPR